MRKIGINTQLYTKDGRIYGNAIIIDIDDDGNLIVQTDYGNTPTISPEDISVFFHTRLEGFSKEQEAEIAKSHKFYVKKPRYEGDDLTKHIFIDD